MQLDEALAPPDRRCKTPLARQIEEMVLRNIELGALVPGSRLPTERELAKRLGVARGTIKAAYRHLEEEGVIRTRQGSGSFVVRDEELGRKLRREKAVGLIRETVTKLSAMGLGPDETARLFDACLAQSPDRVIGIALVSDTPELLMDFKRQLSFLQGVHVSVFILESVTENQSPQETLRAFDLIVVPTAHYERISAMLPGLRERMVEAAYAPSAETMLHLSGIEKSARIGIISRSSSFLALMKENLRGRGFREAQISSFFEMDYTIETYFPGGIDVLISFGDAHIFTNPAFGFRNEEFWAKGGKIIAFRHQIERGTVLAIEDRVRRMCSAG